MLLILGRTNYKLQPKVIAANCRACNSKELHLTGYQNSFHAFFIPIIPLTKSQCLICPQCATPYSFNVVQQALRKDTTDHPFKAHIHHSPGSYDKELKLKTPWWTFSGTILVCVLAALCTLLPITDQRKEAAKVKAFLQNPQAGTLFVIKVDPKDHEESPTTPYLYVKVLSVGSNTVDLQFSKYLYERPPSLAKQSQSSLERNLSDTTYNAVGFHVLKTLDIVQTIQ